MERDYIEHITERADIEREVIIEDLLDSAYNGNWSVAIERFKANGVTGGEILDYYIAYNGYFDTIEGITENQASTIITLVEG